MTTRAVIYRAPHLRQLVSSDPYGQYNCSAVCLARAVNAATLGGLKISGKEVRAMSSEPIPDPASPGLNIPQLVAVSKKLRVPVIDKTGETWAQLVSYLDTVGPGRRVIAQIEYKALGDDRCQAGGDFGHALTLDAIRSRGGRSETLASDPLCTGLRWYRSALIRDAMLAFAVNTGLTGGRVRFAVTREVPMIASEA